MAYALKYYQNFFQVKDYSGGTGGDEYRLEIYLEGYGGASSEIEGIQRNSVKLSRSGDLLDNILGSKLTFEIFNETEEQYKEFRDAAWGDYKVILIKDPNGGASTKFIGYNQSEIYTESYDQIPYSASLEFTDGLSHLKHVRFDDSENEIIDSSADANTYFEGTVYTRAASVNGFQVKIDGVSGSHANHFVNLQTSPDNIVWSNTTNEIQGLGTFTVGSITANYVRLKVITLEGAASSINLTLTPIYTGQKSLIEVIRLCLNKLPEGLIVREFLNIYEDSINSTTTDSMLNQIFVDCSIYREKEDKDEEDAVIVPFFCFDVIEAILKPFNAHIYQADARWFILRPQEYLETTMYYRQFNANSGTESTITVDSTGSTTTNTRTITGTNGTSTELILVAPSTELAIDPPLNRVKVKYNQQNDEFGANNLINDGRFTKWTSLSTPPNQKPTFWKVFGEDLTTYNSKKYVPKSGHTHFQFNPTNQSTASSVDTTKYLEQKKYNVATATTDSLQLNFEFYHMARFDYTGTANYSQGSVIYSYMKNDLSFNWDITLQFGTYYLSGDSINGFSWTTTVSRATIIQEGVGSFAGWKWQNVVEISEDLPTLPQNGVFDMTIKIYQPYTSWTPFASQHSADWTFTWTTLSQSAFDLVYKPIEVEPEEELILYSTIDEDENLEEIEVLHGDGSNSVTNNSFRLSSGAITDVWTRRGLADNAGILTILLRQLRDLRSTFIRGLSGTLIGEFEFYNAIKDTTGTDTIYWLRGYNWSIETNEWDADLMELRNDTATSQTIIDEPKYSGAVSPTPPPTSVPQPSAGDTSTARIGVFSSSTSISINQNNTNNYA